MVSVSTNQQINPKQFFVVWFLEMGIAIHLVN